MTIPTSGIAPASVMPRTGTLAKSADPDGTKAATGQVMLARLKIAGSETGLAIGVMIIVGLLFVPLPSPILDLLLATSIGISVTVLLVTLFTRDPLDFAIFPSLLLLITLLRLGLNVSSTRLILGQGDAGRVIAAFGDAVIGGNYVVGLVIFLILVVINFMVITKGSGRVAEVAARFTLDAMPGRQMSIDADLSAGLIDEDEARRRREEINRYADFYGAMDGAAKFVRGDAVAGLVITAINLVGGFVIGVTQRGLGLSQALNTYTALTVGDGLVTQIPALIVSTAAGIIVTYGAGTPGVGPAMVATFTRHPRAMGIASGILALLAVMPGFPLLPFTILSGVTGAIAWVARARERDQDVQVVESVQDVGQPSTESPPSLSELLHIDPLELDIGYALVPLVDESRKGDLLQRIGVTRKQVALDLGILVPPVRIRDNIQLPATEYAIKLRGVRVARGEIMPQYLLALKIAGATEPLEGIVTTDPSFGIPAVWIRPESRIEAEAAGYSVVEPQTVLSTHLMETVKRHAGVLLRRKDTQDLLNALKETNPALVDDLIPGRLSPGTVHRVLQRLLSEGIPIRDLVIILEILADASEQTKDPDTLAEHVRRALSSVITQLFDDSDGTVRGITIGPRLEAALMTLFSHTGVHDADRLMEPNELTDALTDLSKVVSRHSHDGLRCPLITPPALRLGVRRLVEPVIPDLPVLSMSELPPQTPIQSLATWELKRAA